MRVVTVRSAGDIDRKTPLSKIGVKGIFERELDRLVSAGKADIAVHSLKDVPTTLPGKTVLVAVARRAVPYDAIVPVKLSSLGEGCSVATGSLRRASIVKFVRPDLKVVGIRGNVDTRIQKISRGEADAVMVAEAALKRLGLAAAQRLDPKIFVPSPGQGAIAVTANSSRPDVLEVCSEINHARTMAETSLERRFSEKVGAGCTSPVGVYVRQAGKGDFRLNFSLVSPDARRCIRFTVSAASDELLERAFEKFELLGGSQALDEWKAKIDAGQIVI